MNQSIKNSSEFGIPGHQDSQDKKLDNYIAKSWDLVAPFWPLKNLIAVNPLQGFEMLPFETALRQAKVLFQHKEIPQELQNINRETIKWCQAYFDDGQATLAMPLRSCGLYAAWKKLAQWDHRLHRNHPNLVSFLQSLPASPVPAIEKCLEILQIPSKDTQRFFEILLLTLPGWAAHVKYRTDWTSDEPKNPFPVTKEDYLAMRIVITTLLWPDAQSVLMWSDKIKTETKFEDSCLDKILAAENTYRAELLAKLQLENQAGSAKDLKPYAQFIFCIDVRSEPFRRALESTGAYETFGFAGFFGTPVRIEEEMSEKSYASCPVLLSTKHTIAEKHSCPTHTQEEIRRSYLFKKQLKRLYQSLKYTFSTPFVLVEMLGLAALASMVFKTFFPDLEIGLMQNTSQSRKAETLLKPDLSSMQLEDQCVYAEGALRMIGLTKNFSEVIVFCGHGGQTANNAYATSLDCGACGGHPGGSNARVLAAILNAPGVREVLRLRGIAIPENTRVLAAEHRTTTDEVVIFDHGEEDIQVRKIIVQLKKDLAIAGHRNCTWRNAFLGKSLLKSSDCRRAVTRSLDWAETRPEWGLAKNASFIVGPRSLTSRISLEGRSFLHSYNYDEDSDSAILTTILTAPMVVAHWINSQYLFSTIDNVAFGSGSKVTQNVTGKIGIMQGNSSDLMSGLPIQSVGITDVDLYHEPLRLTTVVYAHSQQIDSVVKEQPVLQKLFGNGWVTMVCIDPKKGDFLELKRDLSWQLIPIGGTELGFCS